VLNQLADIVRDCNLITWSKLT